MISRLSIPKTICSPTTTRTKGRTMKKNIAMLLLASPAALMGQVQAQDQQSYHIDHLEPASWWTGMQSRQLQLMVHGQHIGDLEPTLNYPGVHITSVAHLPNPNYLFIDLDIAPTRRRASWTWSSSTAPRFCTLRMPCRRACKARRSASASTAATRFTR